jgi:hypothetical protein
VPTFLLGLLGGGEKRRDRRPQEAQEEAVISHNAVRPGTVCLGSNRRINANINNNTKTIKLERILGYAMINVSMQNTTDTRRHIKTHTTTQDNRK